VQARAAAVSNAAGHPGRASVLLRETTVQYVQQSRYGLMYEQEDDKRQWHIAARLPASLCCRLMPRLLRAALCF
jgi:hypothetical protein